MMMLMRVEYHKKLKVRKSTATTYLLLYLLVSLGSAPGVVFCFSEGSYVGLEVLSNGRRGGIDSGVSDAALSAAPLDTVERCSVCVDIPALIGTGRQYTVRKGQISVKTGVARLAAFPNASALPEAFDADGFIGKLLSVTNPILTSLRTVILLI